MKEEALTNQKETDRAIKAAVDQSRKFLKKQRKKMNNILGARDRKK